MKFTQSEFSIFENESEIMITLEVDRPTLTEFTVIVVASPDTADGRRHIMVYQCQYNTLYTLRIRFCY